MESTIMSEQGTRKRAEELAVENVRRITEVLREERNNALAIAQTRREEAEKLKKQVAEAAGLLKAAAATAPGDVAARIKDFLGRAGV
jgi:gamma-glutamyl:cysteine ligase YbdK (ATP-grasp superfamily)